MKNDITVVMRSVGERTERVCRTRLAQQVPDKNILMVRNLPLYESTQEVCRQAVDAGRKYTVMIGADYIPRLNMLHTLYAMAEAMSEKHNKWLFVKGTIIDKFLFEYRGDQGGPMLYPTSVLEGWLEILPAIPNRTTTEASCQRHYKELGYPTFRGTAWLALHDFEQHYKDIYRSMYVGGRKHQKLRRRLFPRWLKLSQSDKDYEVALYAHAKGAEHHKKATRKGQVEADFTKDYGWEGSPFSEWSKAEFTDVDFDTEQYNHLSYERINGIFRHL